MTTYTIVTREEQSVNWIHYAIVGVQEASQNTYGQIVLATIIFVVIVSTTFFPTARH